MHTPTTTSAGSIPEAPALPRRRVGHLVRHYLEMVVAMFAGMVLFGKVWDLVWPGLTDRADVMAIVMATDMALGMAAWMRFRRSSWRHIAEMCAAMYVPFLVLLVPFEAGLVSGGAVLLWGHVLMFPAMAAPLVWHRDH